MHRAHPSRLLSHSAKRALPRPLLALASLIFFLCTAAPSQTAPTFQITAATFGTTSFTAVPAGVPGGTLQLTGTLPTSASQAQSPVNACFYTGYGSTTAFPVSLPNGTNTEPLTVPASTIQSIPNTAFTAANNYALTGYLYFVASGGTCTGTFDSTLTNRFAVPVIAPSVTGYTGPTSIPRTSTATSIASPPTYLTLPGRGFLTNGQYGASTPTVVTFGTFGNVTADLTGSALHIPVPAAFSSSSAGTTATLTLCNNFFTVSACTTPPITFTVTALAASTATLTAAPTPVTTAGQTVLSAHFASTPATPGAPSGSVTFVAGSTTLPAARLVLDKTATFATQTTSLAIPTAATPVITPAAGTFLNSATITLTDTTPGASIFYTQDGSAPTTASTPYTAPFQITSSQTLQAIATASGSLPSAVASAAYTITVSSPAKLAFTVQPVSTATSNVLTPAIQLAIQDANGNTVNTSSAPVSIGLQTYLGSPLQGTTTVNAVNGIATFPDLFIVAVNNGYNLVATSPSLASATSSTFNITPIPITITLQSALIGINSTLTGTITLGHAAPSGGLSVTLSSDTPANVTISPATLTIPAGQTTGTFTYTGIASGNATLSAAATNYQTGTAQVTGTAAQVSLGSVPPVAPGQAVSLALSLPSAAPAGGTTVTFTSSNTNVATITSSITVPAGQKTAATNPQVTGVTIGSSNIIASAPGFAPATLTANVTVTASFNQTTNVNLTASTTTTLNISAPAQAGGLTFTLSSDKPSIATVPPSVTILQGATSVVVPITGVSDGSTTVRADSAGVTEATDTVNVASTISVSSGIIVGSNLQTSISLYLPVAPSSPVTVTVSTDDPTAFTIAPNGTTVGTSTFTFSNVTSSYVGTVYIQGQTVGKTANLKGSAPGYTAGSGTVTVYPSGFSFYPYASGNYATTTFSSPSSFNIAPNVLTPGSLNVYTYNQPLSPGVTPVNIAVTSSDTTIGTIQNSPLTFNPGDYYKPFTFTPTGNGVATLKVGTAPAGFSNAATYNTVTETVSAPAISLSAAGTAVNLQAGTAIYLPVAPPSATTVTVTIASPANAVMSSTGTSTGTSTLVFSNVTSSYIGTVYFQGLVAGSTTYSVTASGYTTGTEAVTVYPSGFSLYPYSSSFSTTSFSGPTSVTVSVNPLLSGSLNVNSYGLAISPGVAPVNVTLSSSNTKIGTITGSPITFGPGDTNKTVTFTPVSAGTANLNLGTTPGGGYSTPGNYQSITATVTAPAITASNQIVGVNMQASVAIYLPVAPPSGTTVTITSASPTVATLSQSMTVAGTASQTFTNVTGTYVGTIWIQGLSTNTSTGSTSTLTLSAPGYTSGSSTISVYPSGFSFYPYTGSTFSTTTFSSPNTVTVATNVLNPGSLSVYTYNQYLNPGVTATLGILSSVPSVGAISGSPVTFGPGDLNKSVTFTPGGAGTTNLSIGVTPAGFSTPSNYQQITATVTAPVISVGSATIGVNLQVPIDLYLPQTPPNPVAVTITTAGPGIATIALSDTTVGLSSQTFTNVTSTYVGRIWVQAQSLGTTTITQVAAGYSNGSGTITVYPSGFSFYPYSNSFSTPAGSSPYSLTVATNALNPGTLTINTYNQELNPGIGPVNVSVTSSNTSTGTITTSPLVFNTGTANGSTTFKPLATGTSTLTVGVPSGFSTPSQYQQITATVQ